MNIIVNETLAPLHFLFLYFAIIRIHHQTMVPKYFDEPTQTGRLGKSDRPNKKRKRKGKRRKKKSAQEKCDQNNLLH